MSTKEITKLENQIQKLKEELLEIGPMRPGSLTKQYQDRKKETGAYHQLSYTHDGKSRTDYVRADHVAMLGGEVEEYRRWRELTERWVTLSIELSRAKVTELKELKSRRPGPT